MILMLCALVESDLSFTTARRICCASCRSDVFSFCWSAVGSVWLRSRRLTLVLSGGACDALSCCAQSRPKLLSSKICVSSVPARVFFIYSPHHDVPDFDGVCD